MAEVQYFLKKADSGKETEIKGNLSVGRSQESGLRLTEGNPSRNHARLSLTDGVLFVEDLKSTNGTFVNGTKIESRTRLASNDKVRFDVEEYVLRVDVPAPPPDADRTAMRPQALVAESAKPNLPPAWADAGESPGGGKTVFKTMEQMEEERKRARERAAKAGELGPVSVPQLTIYDGGGLPLTVQLRGSDPNNCEWSVGSDEGREIRIQRDGVSGLHAKIVNSEKVWKVVDQVSGNGTFVNGKRVTVSYLKNGDRIAFGPAECVFQAPDTRTAPTPRPSASAASAAPMDARRKRGLLIAGLSFLGTLLLLVVLLKWLG
ncbi:MAG TPA: FHA domain-containing protein [Steroidobacteraceae bacterium]|jgi:pSer/pThr/pTyr-binding forkhead associated (FHA) protein|nr:FHA domain-containing protein [Steroidobacteraceae bacterium]